MEENKNNDPIQDPESPTERSASEPYDTYPTEDSYTEQLHSEEDTSQAAAETTTTKGPLRKGQRDPEKRMPFLDHLEELRWTLVRSLLAVAVGAIVAYIYSKEIVDFLHRPAPDVKLIFLSPTGAFMTYIKVAIYAGLVFSLPYVAWEFWRFIVPGLLSKERRLVPPIVFFTVLCFLLGAAFAYYVIIPFGLQFLIGGFQTDYLTANITINDYLGFVVTMILVFGVVFELPVLAYFLSLIGLLTPEFLRSKRRYGIVVIFIVAAILTPPDAFTQCMLALPLLVLYEISIWVSAGVRKSKLRKARAEASQN
jgi:sec-independent protein translocase protein TatC